MSNESTMWEQIIDLLEGRLAEPAGSAVRSRVATDPEWAATHAWLVQLLNDGVRPRFASVPHETHQRLEALLPARPTVADDIRRLITSVATLVRDVPIGVAVAGARGVGTRRQLHFDLGDGTDMVLDVATQDDRVVVTGQVLGDAVTLLTATSDQGVTAIAIDELGELTLGIDTPTHLSLDITFATRRATVDLSIVLDPRD